MINFEDFKKIKLCVAKIYEAEKVEGSNKLLKLQIDIGQEKRQILAGIAAFYNPEELIGKSIIVIKNLEPRIMMGLESQGMLLAAHGESGQPILLCPDKEVFPGSEVG